MLLKILSDKLIVKKIITFSDNGLHLVSGISIGDRLHEFNGNVLLEECRKCNTKYLRDFRVVDIQNKRNFDHKTSRKCDNQECGAPNLYDFTFNYKDQVSSSVLQVAQDAIAMADLVLLLGVDSKEMEASKLWPTFSNSIDLVVISNFKT